MRFNVVALAATAGLIWGGAVFVVAASNIIWPPYGLAFLDLVASIYPGYHPGSSIGSVVTGSLYGVVDGAIGGLIFGWLYNLLAGQGSKSA
jgi:hypothetical protein